jgi:DNA-binding transcriptional ArsR family regulator
VAESAEGVESQAPFTLRMAKVFADPLRIKILVELGHQDMSATQFFEQFGGGSVTRVYRHFKVLEKYGWLAKTGEKSGGQRRGATEHFYRATGMAMFDNETWSDLPSPMKELFTWKTFEHYAERVREAMEANTIDSRDDRHFSWIPLLLDEQGWTNVVTKVDELFEFVFQEQAEAELRMSSSGEEPFPVTIGLAAFESPQSSQGSDWIEG